MLLQIVRLPEPFAVFWSCTVTNAAGAPAGTPPFGLRSIVRVTPALSGVLGPLDGGCLAVSRTPASAPAGPEPRPSWRRRAAARCPARHPRRSTRARRCCPQRPHPSGAGWCAAAPRHPGGRAGAAPVRPGPHADDGSAQALWSIAVMPVAGGRGLGSPTTAQTPVPLSPAQTRTPRRPWPSMAVPSGDPDGPPASETGRVRPLDHGTTLDHPSPSRMPTTPPGRHPRSSRAPRRGSCPSCGRRSHRPGRSAAR